MQNLSFVLLRPLRSSGMQFTWASRTRLRSVSSTPQSAVAGSEALTADASLADRMSIAAGQSSFHAAAAAERGAVVARAREGGVGIVNIGTQPSPSSDAVQLARQCPDSAWATV